MDKMFNIPFDKVFDLITEVNEVLVYKMEPIKLSDDDFRLFKFELIKWVKQKENPEDRLFHFETLNEMVYSYDKENHLIEARKTRAEKQAEIKEAMEFKAECKRMGIV